MDRLREALRALWQRIVAGLKAFENSSLFERAMRRYESLTPSGQRLVKFSVQIGGILFIAFLILGGPFMLLSKIQKINTLEKLEGDVAAFQSEYDSKTKGFSAPNGWRPFASGSAGELVANFNEYLLNIGVPEEFGSLTNSGDNLNLTLKEISIRQATNIMFELEALFPKLRTTNFAARPNAGKPDIIDMDATFVFNPAFASQFADATPTGGEANYEVPSEPIDTPPVKTGRKSTGTPSSTRPNVPGNGDFENNYVPPPPPPPGDFEEFTPPDIPDDLPAPPPPPGFEDNTE